MPGDRLLSWIRNWFDEGAVHRVFEPLIADWQREWHDARGVRRVWVALSGGAALLWTMGRMCDLPHLARRQPAAAFALLLIGLATLTAVFTAMPFQVNWMHWDPANPRVWWTAPSPDLLYLTPDPLAFGLLFALLPAALLATVAGWPLRRVVAATLITIGAAIALHGWIAPMAHEERRERFWARAGRQTPARHPVLHATLGDVAPLTRDADPAVATQARLQLNRAASLGVVALAMAWLGAALGRARAASGAAVTVSALVGWWIFAWAVFRLLEYWSRYFGHAIGVRLPFATWLPPLALLALAALAWVLGPVARSGGRRAAPAGIRPA